jgi:hypothetical protein
MDLADGSSGWWHRIDWAIVVLVLLATVLIVGLQHLSPSDD